MREYIADMHAHRTMGCDYIEIINDNVYVDFHVAKDKKRGGRLGSLTHPALTKRKKMLTHPLTINTLSIRAAAFEWNALLFCLTVVFTTNAGYSYFLTAYDLFQNIFFCFIGFYAASRISSDSRVSIIILKEYLLGSVCAIFSISVFYFFILKIGFAEDAGFKVPYDVALMALVSLLAFIISFFYLCHAAKKSDHQVGFVVRKKRGANILVALPVIFFVNLFMFSIGEYFYKNHPDFYFAHVDKSSARMAGSIISAMFLVCLFQARTFISPLGKIIENWLGVFFGGLANIFSKNKGEAEGAFRERAAVVRSAEPLIKALKYIFAVTTWRSVTLLALAFLFAITFSQTSFELLGFAVYDLGHAEKIYSLTYWGQFKFVFYKSFFLLVMWILIWAICKEPFYVKGSRKSPNDVSVW
ncbi:MAG: hypothetical protein VX836_02855 [Pseudomonadota bacterium]|nr:hypothetical protein [Pseudomonadota bacterium]